MSLPAVNGQLINWIGHAAGTLVFGLFFLLLWQDRSTGRGRALAAAFLAFLWNGVQLAALASGGSAEWMEAFASAALSLLPALLFDLVAGGAPRWATGAGYLFSAVAIGLHLAELVSSASTLHAAGLYMVAAGFGVLAIYAALVRRQRVWPALSLLLLALSLLHFSSEESHAAWRVELAVHHAGIPLAMFVLLQDYRFVFLDALVRVLANILVALVFSAAALAWLEKWPESAIFGLTGLFILFAITRTRAQTLLTRLLFRRGELDTLLASIRPAADEAETIAAAGLQLRAYFGATETIEPEVEEIEGASLVRNGAEAALGVRLHSGQLHVLRFGRRPGGRRYLSEDLDVLEKTAAALRIALETVREAELRRLVAEAELRALQAQIHPHFLFNVLNTLYGIIPREADRARQMVLNLSDLFRYVLTVNQTFVSLEDELQIIHAYLEIESLRLGDRLKTHIHVDDSALAAQIPLLSIEPLVENAVKHGIASRAEGGSVRVQVLRRPEAIEVEVSDTGSGFVASDKKGMGLDNVERRLRLCYGAGAALHITSTAQGTSVRFTVPGAA